MIQPFDEGRTLQAWQRFVNMGELMPYIPAPVARSWFRCKNRGQLAVQLLPGQLPKEPGSMETNIPLGKAFQQTFSSLDPYLRSEELLLALVDPRGVLLEWQGTHRFIVGGSLQKGMLLQEETLGTMAVSLALKETDTFFVQGAEHFCSCYHQIASFAAPIMKQNECLGFLAGWTALPAGSLAAVAVSLGKQVLESCCIS
jgi:transcriptional regulator of acetoin/glycerol metabolism